MAEGRQSPVRDLVYEAIRRLVADGVASGEILCAGREAIRLANTYPGSGLSPEDIAEEIIQAAISAGLTTEMSRPDQTKHSGRA